MVDLASHDMHALRPCLPLCSVSAGTGSAAATRHTVAPSRAPINRPPATTLHASGAEGSRRDEQARQKQVPSVHGGMDGEDCATEVEPTDISVTEKTPRCDSPVECTEAAACHSVVCKEGGAGISATKGPSSAGREPGTHVVQLSTVSKTKSSLSILVNPVQVSYNHVVKSFCLCVLCYASTCTEGLVGYFGQGTSVFVDL